MTSRWPKEGCLATVLRIRVLQEIVMRSIGNRRGGLTRDKEGKTGQEGENEQGPLGIGRLVDTRREERSKSSEVGIRTVGGRQRQDEVGGGKAKAVSAK